MQVLYIYDDKYIPFLFNTRRVVTGIDSVYDSSGMLLKVKGSVVPDLPFIASNLMIQLGVSTSDCTIRLDNIVAVFKYMACITGLKWGKRVEKTVTQLSEDNAFYAFKMTITLRKWCLDGYYTVSNVYKLFQSLMKSDQDFLEQYFLIRKNAHWKYIWSAVLTFLSKVDNFSPYDDYSPAYKETLFKAGSQLANYKRVLYNVLQNKNFNEVDMIACLLKLKT